MTACLHQAMMRHLSHLAEVPCQEPALFFGIFQEDE